MLSENPYFNIKACTRKDKVTQEQVNYIDERAIFLPPGIQHQIFNHPYSLLATFLQ